MQMHPSHAHFMVNQRTGELAAQVKHQHLIQTVKALEQAQNGRSPARLSLASLRSLVGFGNGRGVQGPEVDQSASRPDLVKTLKPEEQCC